MISVIDTLKESKKRLENVRQSICKSDRDKIAEDFRNVGNAVNSVIEDVSGSGNIVQGIYYGTDMQTCKPIILDRLTLKHPHGIMIGYPGAGMHYVAQNEISQVYHSDLHNNIIILDANGKYNDLYHNLISSAQDKAEHRITVFDASAMNPNFMCAEMPQNLKIINDTIAENYKKSRRTWVYITDIRPLVHEGSQNQYLRELIEQADSSNAILTFMAERWKDIPGEITKKCQYIQLFAPGIHQDIDRDLRNQFLISDQIVSCVENYLKGSGYQRRINGLVTEHLNDTGKIVFAPFMYDRD